MWLVSSHALLIILFSCLIIIWMALMWLDASVDVAGIVDTMCGQCVVNVVCGQCGMIDVAWWQIAEHCGGQRWHLG